MKRQRATVIVEIDGQILLVQNRGGLLLLPGGGIGAHETRLEAAARELAEETRLGAESLLFLFSHESSTHCHNVFWAAAAGTPVAGDDAMALDFYDQRQPDLTFSKMSQATREIIERFLAIQASLPPAFAGAGTTTPLVKR
ncbi:NUDIX hydrolase [Candidatus Accumulibacter aalborgensis]|uniref:NUDIX hydrolase n=1 Tax=Candidatus Accumulibacter aalborgensis TaxID=1860102 RepID=A0A1A8XVV5_9PROT|nr:NUDIX domain-containing protein [Candidatus Accumulibacter aalborgensis]SBT09145.1 NUDIX hydrolase [Candidatus Accumulibacter aalborgensis]